MNRREKILKKLNESGLDGLLFASGANFQYVVESNSYFWQRYCFNLDEPVAGARIIPEAMVYLNKDGKSTILTTPLLKEHFDTTLNDVVVSYMDQFEDELTKIIDGKKIGIGRDCEAWFRKTLNVKLIEVEDIFYDLRRIKDEKEIALMTKLGKFTDDAVMYVCKHLKPGMTMFEAERMIVDYGLKTGMADLSFPPTCGFKTRNTENAQNIEPFENDRKLVEGTMIAFDIGYMDRGYCSDWGRTVYYGKAPELVKKGYEALQAGETYMVSKIVPGVTKFGELYGFICDKVEELGYYDYLRFKRDETGGNGHHIGSEVHELPFLVPGDDLVLEPGMIFCSEPKMFFKNEGYMRVEDMILVTEDGAEFLTNFPRDLFEIEL
ncbi:MAG: Xaa-Pro peptidase family protein [Solobacterium sp.]|nr:Xaa-Pro peptidase family protein [Solobacterium sp.]MDY4495106.1 Xaa-Pro peptidase family protein [Erysipelotrichaceae bacterium]MDY5276908.1 Xaa-Pro peptidase family protein [Erysipelotrichaceae bacterium]MDY5401980.1 Xaa-Pro peptidase family protein [Erysipelotrichaceae bacterium]